MKACARLDLEGYLKKVAPRIEEEKVDIVPKKAEQDDIETLRQLHQDRFLAAMQETMQQWQENEEIREQKRQDEIFW